MRRLPPPVSRRFGLVPGSPVRLCPNRFGIARAYCYLCLSLWKKYAYVQISRLVAAPFAERLRGAFGPGRDPRSPRGDRSGPFALRFRPLERCPSGISRGPRAARSRRRLPPAVRRLPSGRLCGRTGCRRCRGYAAELRGALSGVGLQQRRPLRARLLLLRAGRHEAGQGGTRADRLRGARRFAARTLRHPYGLCGVRRRELRRRLRPLLAGRREQPLCRPRMLLPRLHRLRRGPLRPCPAGVRVVGAQRGLRGAGALLPAADSVPRGRLPLCGRRRREAAAPFGGAEPPRGAARDRRVALPAGGVRRGGRPATTKRSPICARPPGPTTP